MLPSWLVRLVCLGAPAWSVGLAASKAGWRRPMGPPRGDVVNLGCDSNPYGTHPGGTVTAWSERDGYRLASSAVRAGQATGSWPGTSR